MSILDTDVVFSLLATRVAGICLVDPATLVATTRFAADLGADSLDLVEIVEGVEHDLAERGVAVTLPDDALMAMETLGDATAEIARRGRPA